MLLLLVRLEVDLAAEDNVLVRLGRVRRAAVELAEKVELEKVLAQLFVAAVVLFLAVGVAKVAVVVLFTVVAIELITVEESLVAVLTCQREKKTKNKIKTG